MRRRPFTTLSAPAIATLAVGLGSFAVVPTAQAGPTVFSTSGTTIAGTHDEAKADVTFSQSGSTLTITVRNLGVTSSNASLLDGIFFDTDSSGAVSKLPTAAAARAWTSSGIRNSVDFTGGWQMLRGVTIGGNTYSYGLSAVGGSGLFASNAFAKGNGGDDYGLIGSETCGTTKCETHVNKKPVAIGTLTFTLSGFTGTVISKVTLAYNSALSVLVGTNKTSGPTPTPSPVNVPEPASLVLLGFGAGAIGLLRRRRKA
ncbi:MAG: hypothetical protein BGO51_06580 [Rhodospirillales bacterium 69-11]|nr:PEP-CTERM sorting domain-containing protein [Rhodospirillales bacterium]OJW24006.1 MAG: hypothetical protein BGO51_06580 [Rhodospirillales bacterium 69-11]